jgi:site-specific recombinase
MKVFELKAILEHTKDENEVMIAIKLPYATVGAIPMVSVKSATNGFDWENGKFIFRPEEELTPADRDFAKQMKEMQDKLGWAQYENSNLKAEVKRLQAKLNAN